LKVQGARRPLTCIQNRRQLPLPNGGRFKRTAASAGSNHFLEFHDVFSFQQIFRLEAIERVTVTLCPELANL